MSQILRPYQTDAVNAVFDAIEDGYTRILYTLATGTGKTSIMADLVQKLLEYHNFKVLILAHRRELITQAYERIKSHCGLDEYGIGIELAETKASHVNQVVIGSVFTVVNKSRLPSWKPDAIITDECFPAGTLVDGCPIEQVKVGDFVRCFNHASRSIERRRVVRLYRNPVRSLLRVHLSNGQSVVCTPSHPFFTGTSYTPASDLSQGYLVWALNGETLGAEIHNRSIVRRLRNSVPTSQLEQHDDADMLSTLQRDTARTQAQKGTSLLPYLPKGNSLPRQMRVRQSGSDPARTCLLFSRMPRGRSRFGFCRGGQVVSAVQPAICVRAHEVEQSYAQGRLQGEDDGYAAQDWTSAETARREWQTVTEASANASRCSDMADRGCSLHEDASRFGVPDMLQNRHSKPAFAHSHRGGRRLPCGNRTQGAGRQETAILSRVRVENVEVLEPGSDGEFRGLCSGGLVYNIEVEGIHNYFANGILVHNCHRGAAPTYQKIYERFGVSQGKCISIGCTATAKRTDKKSLYAFNLDDSPVTLFDKKTKQRVPADPTTSVFEKHAFDFSILDAIEGGWLVPVIGHSVQTETDLNEVGTDTDGDFKEGELARAVDNLDRTMLAISAWKQKAEHRPTIVFCAGVEHAYHSAELWRQAGYTAAALGGEEAQDSAKRWQILSDFKAGRLQVLCNMGLFTEGTDLPTAACIVHLRPTKSWNLYVQMSGRGTRPLAGVLDAIQDCPPEVRRGAIAASDKPDCLIIDLVDLCKSNDLCAVPSILDLPADMDMEGQSLTEAKKLLDEFEEVKDRVIGECPRTYRELKARLEEVNLLLNSGARTVQDWKSTDDGYRFARVPVGYKADLIPDDGGWRLTVTSATSGTLYDKIGYPRGEFKEYLDRAAEAVAKAVDSHRKDTPKGTLDRLSVGQIRCLLHHHSREEIDKMPIGYAKKLIPQYIQEWKSRQDEAA